MSAAQSSIRSRGFTLIELLVVIAIIAVLVAILLPAVQQAREAARRSACNNNLKQLGLALHNYHDAHKVFPVGATYNYNFTWMVQMLPFMEYESVYDRLQQVSLGSYPNGSCPLVNAESLDQLTPTGFICPSTDLPKLAENSGPAVGSPEGVTYRFGTSCYAGIAGAGTSATSAVDPTGRGRCADGTLGYVCSNGVLGPNRSVSIDEIRDGTTFTMMVGEQSHWIVSGSTNRDFRSSARWGFAMGAGAAGFPGGPGTWTGNNQLHNITTIRYPVNHNTSATGVSSTQACTNSPIGSAHRGGAFVLRADGGSKFLSDGINFTILRNLAIYDDKQIIKSNPLE